MSAALPAGYLKAKVPLSASEIEKLSERWHAAFSGKGAAFRIPVLGPDVEFVPFAGSLPDAFCKYCGIANLAASVWCGGCGAPLLRES
jgi:hypothetical protein